MSATFGLRDVPLQPDSKEFLGLDKYATALAAFAEQCETPMTIALQGDWGSGKTSLMNLIRGKMRERSNNYVPVWFNTWQYSQFGLQDQLALSLIARFIDAIPDKTKDEEDTFKRIGNGLRILGGAAMKFAMAVADHTTGLPMAKAANSAMEGLAQDNYDPSKEIDTLKKKLEEVVARITTGENKKKIVVFVDDLDRLPPIKAVELLESFKLFLDIPGCVFFLACDYKVVIQGLKAKFGENVGDTNEKNFFDKIIQLPFKMPVAQYDAEKYIQHLLNNIGITCDDKSIKQYDRLIESSIGFNPRGLKRAFNSLLLLSRVADSDNLLDDTDIAKRHEKEKLLFAVVCMQSAYENLYNMISKGKIRKDFFEKSNDKGDESGYSKIITELTGGKDDQFNIKKLDNFVDALYAAMQLASDDDDTSLSNDEYEEFMRMMKLSSVTSTSDSEEIVYEPVNTKEKRNEIEIICANVIKNLKAIPQCGKLVKRLKTKFPEKSKWHRGTSDREIVFEDETGNYFGSFEISVCADTKDDYFQIYIYYNVDEDGECIGRSEILDKLSDIDPIDDEDREDLMYEHIFKKSDSLENRVSLITDTSLKFIDAILEVDFSEE